MSSDLRARMASKLPPAVERRGVLAGAYSGLHNRPILTHYVALRSLKVGRIVREKGETLCGRIPSEHMCDSAEDRAPLCDRCSQMQSRYLTLVVKEK
jgi:hypothetical protein